MSETNQPGGRRAGGKPNGEHGFRRRISLLSILPEGHQDGISASVLAERLAGRGHPCTKRTVERDLVAIASEAFWKDAGIRIRWKSGTGDPRLRLWTYEGARKLTLLQAPSGEDALLIRLMAQELQSFLPESAMNVLSSYQPVSDGALKQLRNTGHAHYHDKVRTVSDGPLALPPSIDTGTLRTLNEALLREEQIDVQYYASSRHTESRYRLHPIGTVKKGLFFWLIAFKEVSGRLVPPVRNFRIDRVRSVRRRVNEPVAASLPRLQEVLDTGLLGFFPKDLIGLRMRSACGKPGDELINNYRDTPLSLDQRITPLEEGGYQLDAQVHYTRELVWMLQGQAHLLEVVEPPELRQELQKFTALAAQRYGSVSGLIPTAI